MSLILAQPGPNPITTLSTGIKIVRLAEYLGGARGTLTTATDSLSPANEVVVETQALSPPTTFANRWSSVSNTCVIPVSDFGLQAESFYAVYISVRTTGSTPLNGKAGETFTFWRGNNAQPSIAFGFDGTLSNQAFIVPKGIFAHYNLIPFGSLSPSIISGKTNYQLRAWGLTSTDTITFYLDLLYLIPEQLHNTDDPTSFFATEYSFYINSEDDGWPAVDEVEDNEIGSRSLFYSEDDQGGGAAFDLQPAFDEYDETDWRDMGFDDEDDPKSYIYIVGCGSRLINPHTVDDVDFSDATTPIENYITPGGYWMYGNFSTSFGHIYAEDGVWRISTPDDPTHVIYPYAFAAANAWSYGSIFTISGSNPSTYYAQIGNLESCIMTAKFNLSSGPPPGADFYNAFGLTRWTQPNSGIPRFGVMAYVLHKQDGTNTIEMRYEDNVNFPHLVVDGGDPVSCLGTLTTGDSYWIKYEKRLYRHRVKIWLDGDPEPDTWIQNVHEPAHWSNSISGGYTAQYPWTTPDFPVSGSNTYTNNPLTISNSGNSLGNELGFAPYGEWGVDSGGFFPPSYTPWTFEMDSIKVEYDPDPDDEGTYTGAYFNISKYDGSEDWGTVYVPPGAMRVLYTNYADHHFASGTHGGNFSAWKNGNGKPLQGAEYKEFYFRKVTRTINPVHLDLRFRGYEPPDVSNDEEEA